MQERIISLFTVILIMAIGLQAQTTYFASSFEQGMPETFQNWDIDENQPSTDMANLGFAVGIAWIVTNEGDDNNHVACSTSWYKKAGTSNDWLVLPAIEVKDAEAKIIWRARTQDKDYRDGYKLYIGHFPDESTGRDYIMPDDFQTEPLFSSAKENYDWTVHEISLADYVGQTIYLAFVNDSKDKACLYIDDIFVGVPATVGLSLDFKRCYDGYGDIPVSGKAYANLSQPVHGYTIGIEMNGKTIEQTFGGTLEPGVQVPFTLDDKLYLEKNATADYRAWIKAGDDQGEISGRLSAYQWKVVAEEITGTWDQYSVRGIGAMNYMRENNPDGFIGIAVHADVSNIPDSMAIPGHEYLNWLMSAYNMNGYPYCVMNRNAQYSVDPSNIPTTVANIKKNEQNFYGLAINASYDSETNLITGNTSVAFAKDFENANFKLAYIVIENDVHRTHAETGILNNYCGYDQINGYAGGGLGECYGFESKPSSINADDIWYQDVARGYDGNDGYKGIEGIIPNNISDGDIVMHQMELSMPSTVLKKENTELIVLLLDNSGSILNAEKCNIEMKLQQTLGLDALPEMTYGDEPYQLPIQTEQGLPLQWEIIGDKDVVHFANDEKCVIEIGGTGTVSLSATQIGNVDFEPFFKEFQLTVNKAPLVITAMNYTRYYGEENPEFSAQYESFVYGEDESVLKTKPTISTTATISSPVGKYPITASGAEAANYNINYIDGILTITVDPTFMIDGIVYDITSEEEKTVQVGDNKGFSGDAVIPESVEHGGKQYAVTTISNEAFSDCSELTSVTIPASVTSIGALAFIGCSGLTSVTIPNSVTSIFEGAFSGCSSMTAVTISASISSISDGVFNDCSGLTSVSIPSSVTSIGEYAFSGCSGLASVTIPVSVTSIGYSAFHDCQPTTVEVSLNDKSAFINNHVANLIRKNIRFKNLLLINESGAEEKDFIIPNDITTIGEFAFYNCSGLTSVTIPNSVTSISDNAFTGCDNLNSVVLHCPSIGNCFQGHSSIQEVFLGEEVSSISGSAFNGCSGLTSVTSKIVSPFAIQSGAFGGVSPECILTVPKGMVNEYIAKGWNMFGGGVFDESIRCIDGIYYALDSGKKTATVTNQYGYDGDSDYSWLKASYADTLDIPDVVTYDGEQYIVSAIGKNALRKCNDLTAVCLPDGLTDATTLKDLQAKIYVNRGTTTLLALWTIGKEPYEKNTDNVLTAPKFDIATTQTTATLKATPIYPEYTYAYNDMIPLGEEGIRWTGLYPEYSEEVTLNVMLGTQCYESKQTFTTQSLAPKVIASQRTASSITFKGIYTEGDADVDDEHTLTVDGENILGDTKTLTGLEPNTGYTAYFTVRVHYGDNGQYTKSYTGTSTLQTEPISFTTLPAKIITADDVIVSSAVNLNDAETTAGFEWRVAGGDEDLFESKYGQAYLYEGMMEGTIHKLNPNYLWKFRPYYQSANGYYYYGNWKGIDLSDNQSYFEPTVHTYAGVEMGDGAATVSGYAQRGSDEIAEEGFEYWEESGNTSEAPLHAPAYASIPDNAMKVLADGTLMQAQLTGLTPNSTYGYVAFVRTIKGKTYYGVVRQFTTGEHQQATSVEAFNAKQAPTNEAIYDLLGRKHDNLHKGVNIIRMEDGSTRKVYVK